MNPSGHRAIRAVVTTAMAVCALASTRPAGRHSPVNQSQVTTGRATFESRTDLVRVGVGVLDEDGRALDALTARDFALTVNGRAVEIAVFDTIPSARSTSPRLVALVFDAWIPFESQRDARRMARHVVETLGPDDLMIVIRAGDPLPDRSTPLPFSADRERLRAAADAPLHPATRPRTRQPDQDVRAVASASCTCGACIEDTIARIADDVAARPDRRAVVNFIGTFFASQDEASPNACRNAATASRERLSSLMSPVSPDSTLDLRTADPRHRTGVDLDWIFIRNQYEIGLISASPNRPRDIFIDIKAPSAGKRRWEFRIQG